MVDEPIVVTIIAAPVACEQGISEQWREVAGWVGTRLKSKYEHKVITRYYNFFELESPAIMAGCQLPIVMVNDLVVSNGGKISIPLICKAIEALAEQQ